MTNTPDYQIDYLKLYNIKKRAQNKSYETKKNVTPLLMVFFSDKAVVWDLNKTKWEDSWEWKWGDKGHGKYGEANNKEWDLQAHLKINDAIYVKEYE